MAHKTLLPFAVNSMVGDNSAQLVGGDAAALFAQFLDRPVLAFDDTDEAAAISAPVTMPGQYAGGTLKATIKIFIDNNADDVSFDIFVEAVTPDTDTLNMETTSSWDTANAGTVSLGGSTAKDCRSITVTLANKDSVAAGDLVRFGIRRDCDSANDDAAATAYLSDLEIWEDT